MKPVLLTIFFLFPILLFAQQDKVFPSENNELITAFSSDILSSGYESKTKTEMNWDSLTGSWDNVYLNIYNYNENQLIDTLVLKEANGNTWVNLGMNSFHYSGQNVFRENHYYWFENNWKYSFYRIYEYSNGYLRKIVEYDPEWNVGLYRTEYYKNANHLDTTIEAYWRHPIYFYWMASYKYTNKYDAKDRLIEKIHFDGRWFTPYYYYFYNYNNLDLLVKELILEWEDTIWVNDRILEYEYTNTNKRARKTKSVWLSEDSLWQYVWRENYYYDSNDSLIAIVKENRDSTGTWVNDERTDFTYDPLQTNYLVEELLRKWNGNAWVNIKRYLWDYEFPFTSVDDPIQINKFKLYQNYPNPFNPSTKIKFTIPEITLRQAQSDRLVTLKVYDVLGKEVATLVNEYKPAGSYEVEFNPEASIKNPASGIYFYKLHAGDFVETKKMIYLK